MNPCLMIFRLFFIYLDLKKNFVNISLPKRGSLSFFDVSVKKFRLFKRRTLTYAEEDGKICTTSLVQLYNLVAQPVFILRSRMRTVNY